MAFEGKSLVAEIRTGKTPRNSPDPSATVVKTTSRSRGEK